MAEIIIRGGVVVTMDPQWQVLRGDVVCVDGLITRVGGEATPTEPEYDILDAEHCLVMPGLVQSHTHMCQTLARGRGDALELLPWLESVVWPHEGKLSSDDVAAAARLACAELIQGGTTAIQDMGTVHHTDALFEVARDAGLRATIGKAMMDDPDGRHPPGLRESSRESLAESERLCSQWHGAEGDRLRYAFAPRFALSCTDGLLRDVAALARACGARLHTHASENRDEIELVRRLRGRDNIAYLHDVGLTGHDVSLAHCVWLEESERLLLRDTGTHVLHCPSSNLKLGSGIAPIPELIGFGIAVSLGADGAPCNNNLDAFVEMRLAGLIHRPRTGPAALPAVQVVKMATLGGARALGLDHCIGSLEVGKRADVIVVETNGVHVAPTGDPYSALVHSCRSTDVRHSIIDGAIVMRDRTLLTLDPIAAVRDAHRRAQRLCS